MKNVVYFALFNVFVVVLDGQLEAQENSTSNMQTNEPMLPISSPPDPPAIVSNENSNDRLHCPMTNDAVSSCDQSNIFYYYECCGQLNMYCCLKFREWFWMAVVVLGSLVIVVFTATMIRCLCCRAQTSSYDF